MVALAEIVRTEIAAADDAIRPLDPYDRQAIRRELNRWGVWKDRQNTFNGYPSADTTYAARMGRGSSGETHRVLMLDMPVDVWATNARVNRLPERLQAVIYAAYVGVMREDLTMLTWEQKAARVNMTGREMSIAHTEALRAILGLGY